LNPTEDTVKEIEKFREDEKLKKKQLGNNLENEFNTKLNKHVS